MKATDAEIRDVERRFRLRLPDDYRQFLLEEGAFRGVVAPAGGFLDLWPLADVVGVNEIERTDNQGRFPGGFVIGGNGGREMLIYDLRVAEPPLYLVDISAPGWSSGIRQATSLTEFRRLFPETGWVFETPC